MVELEPRLRKTYTQIIDGILAESDIETISAKAIRRGLAERGHDISDHREEVNALIMARFDIFNSGDAPTTNGNGHGDSNSTSTPISDSPHAPNGHSHTKKRTTSDASASSSNPSISSPPPKKKAKKAVSVEEDDAAYAARLQAELNAASRTRATRGAATRKDRPAAGGSLKGKGKKVKRAKKKSANIIEDSDAESGEGGDSGDGPVKERKKGGFHKEFALSAPLAALVGESQLSRPATVKKIWQYIKANDLQVPEDKRNIRCDEALRAVFKQDKVHMFSMNKALSQHFYPLDAE